MENAQTENFNLINIHTNYETYINIMIITNSNNDEQKIAVYKYNKILYAVKYLNNNT
jgi:hypothetical protein